MVVVWPDEILQEEIVAKSVIEEAMLLEEHIVVAGAPLGHKRVVHMIPEILHMGQSVELVSLSVLSKDE